MDERSEHIPHLVREVEPPQRQHSGIGVMIVASAAMFFAVASSAFLLRARMTRRCPYAHASPVIVDWEPSVTNTPRAAAQNLATAADCGEAVYRNNPDGSVTVFFNLCPTAPDMTNANGAQATPVLQGVAVHPIVDPDSAPAQTTPPRALTR